MIARLPFKSASKTTKLLALATLLAAAGAFAACSASSDDDSEDSAAQVSGNSLPYMVKPCPGHGCK